MSRKKLMTEYATVRMTTAEKAAINSGRANAKKSLSRYLIEGTLNQQFNSGDSGDNNQHRESRDALARSLRALFAEQVEQKNALDALARYAKRRSQKDDSCFVDAIKTASHRVAQNAAKLESYFLEIERFV